MDILLNLADLHYEFGLIDFSEYNERVGIALWLADNAPEDFRDPREAESEAIFRSDFKEPGECSIESKPVVKNKCSTDNTPDWIEFLFDGIWVFTKADEDPYPSVPHGHYQHQNRKWPKLNPYTGRVFGSKHQEDISSRLSKKKMKELWLDEKFRSFCREMIVWYLEHQPHHKFSVRHPLRFPRW